MENNRLISVIVPVYNGERYIARTIRSLSDQTYTDFEVLIINDFSTDRSTEIIRQMTGTDQRFRLIHAAYKLGTAAKGQEYGMPYCRGYYYFYMSQDDFIAKDFFETCVNKSIQMNADAVLPNCINYYGTKSAGKFHGKYPLNGNYHQTLSPKRAFELSMTWEIHGFAFRKMELVKKTGIAAKYYNSCEYYVRLSYLNADKIVFADTDFYYRQNNPEAITKGIRPMHIDVLKTDIMLLERYIEEGFPKRKCIKRYKALTGGWLAWWMKAVRSHILFVHHGYVFKSLRSTMCGLLMLIPKLFRKGTNNGKMK